MILVGAGFVICVLRLSPHPQSAFRSHPGHIQQLPPISLPIPVPVSGFGDTTLWLVRYLPPRHIRTLSAPRLRPSIVNGPPHQKQTRIVTSRTTSTQKVPMVPSRSANTWTKSLHTEVIEVL